MTKLLLAMALLAVSIGTALACEYDKTVTAQTGGPQTVVDGAGTTLPITPVPATKSGG